MRLAGKKSLGCSICKILVLHPGLKVFLVYLDMHVTCNYFSYGNSTKEIEAACLKLFCTVLMFPLFAFQNCDRWCNTMIKRWKYSVVEFYRW